VCQKQNRETVASGLGWELFSQGVRAIKEVKPKYFIYENNKSMSKAIRDSIDSTFGFEAIMINSSLVSGQHRQRLYWVGKRNLDGTYSKVDVQQPEDRGIMLQDVLDGIADRDKARTMLTSIGRTTPREYYMKHQNTLAAEPVNIVDGGKSFALKSTYYKSATANFLNGGGHYPASGVDSTRSTTPLAKSEPVRVGTYPNNAKNQAHDSQQYRIYSITAKSVTLCGNGGGMGAKTGLYAIPIEFDGEVPTRAISGADGKAYDVWQVSNGEIFIKDKQYPVKLQDGYYIVRKLTVNECKRLQTVPEWYEFPVSDTQAYKMLGNGWTVSVIAHLLNAIKKTHHNE
jgi:DNA (cytosine-5)-methyltransferase 3A